MPSIFNDVIGPVMRGPSSSHTAASHRIGSIIRQFCLPEGGRVVVEFDRHGSLATTYEGQGTTMGLISGLLGLSILDRNMIRYSDLARERGLDIKFNITDLDHKHPNTYKILVEDRNSESFSFVAVSTGGGMIEFIEINGYEVSLKGDFFETLICFEPATGDEIQMLYEKLRDLQGHSEIYLVRSGNEKYLIDIKSRQSVSGKEKVFIDSLRDASWIRHIDPVMPVIGGFTGTLPFTSVDEMLAIADNDSRTLSDLALAFESARSGMEPDRVVSMMSEIVSFVKNSVSEGLSGTVFKDRILGHQSHLILEAEKEKRILVTPVNRIIAYVTALMEAKSSMGIIVAAPTAGSSGVLGGTILALAEGASYSDEEISRAFLAAGLIGVFIADRYTFAAEEGGCQVECGAASGMTAAGLVTLMGGTAREAIDASSMALQNMLGLICDPVADRVEVPCLGKNILAAVNALTSANMSLAGFDKVIPLNEVIDAMKSVGESLPSSLCCTGLGGLSITPTALSIRKKLKLNNPKH